MTDLNLVKLSTYIFNKVHQTGGSLDSSKSTYAGLFLGRFQCTGTGDYWTFRLKGGSHYSDFQSEIRSDFYLNQINSLLFRFCSKGDHALSIPDPCLCHDKLFFYHYMTYIAQQNVICSKIGPIFVRASDKRCEPVKSPK